MHNSLVDFLTHTRGADTTLVEEGCGGGSSGGPYQNPGGERKHNLAVPHILLYTSAPASPLG